MAAVADSPFVEPRRALTGVVETIAIAALLGLGVHHLAESFASSYESWRSGLGLYWSHARPVFHGYSTGLAGLGCGFATIGALVAGRGRRWYVRAIAGVIGALLVAQVVVDGVHDGVVPPVTLDVLGVVCAVLAAAWVGIGRASQTHTGSSHWIAAPVIVAIAIATGFPLISITWAGLTQHHLPFTIETAAAYDLRGAYVIVNDPHPEIVDVSGIRYEIDRSDALRFDQDDIGEIRRDGDEIIVHITNTDKARALTRRSAQRMSMIDALYVNGRRIGFPRYDAILLGGFVAFKLDADAGAMWAALASR